MDSERFAEGGGPKGRDLKESRVFQEYENQIMYLM